MHIVCGFGRGEFASCVDCGLGRSACCVIVFDVVAFAVDLVAWVSKCRRGIVNA